MTFVPGTRLGPYEIVGKIGAGGMGEVWKAQDTRLGRDVAIKVLPAGFAEDPERLRRFQQEARTLAALSHPNVVQVFEAGEHDGAPYLVMELLEGDTLRERMHGKALPVKRATEIAREAALGLSAAHGKGILHRDFKPENIFLTRDGRVKVLDFGLAKTHGTAASSKVETRTVSTALSEPGHVVGTSGYMSPEQVRGEPLDARSDLFSLGVVLWEMVTGEKPFRGDSSLEVMHAILKDEPPELDPSLKVPPMLERVLNACLAKEPGSRIHSAHDLAFALEGSFATTSTSGGKALPKARRRMSPLLAGCLGAAFMLLGGFLAYSRQWPPFALRSQPVFHQKSFRPQAIFQAAFLPDGQSIVYSAALEGNVPELFLVRPEYPEPQPIGLPCTHLLSVSSKGELAVLTNPRYGSQRYFTGTLARVALGGTAPREILEKVRQADWSPDGSELAIIRWVDHKDRLEYPIGNVLYQTGGYLSDLRVSPRGDRVALFDHPKDGDDRGSVIVVDRAGRRTVLSGEYESEEGLAWSGDEILFTASITGSANTLYAVDLSGRRRVLSQSAGGLTMHDVSRTGRWLVTHDAIRTEIPVLAPGAKAERDLTFLDTSTGPYLSGDGRMLLFEDESSEAGPNYGVCLRSTEGGPVVRLGEGSPNGLSPDGKWALANIQSPPQIVLYPTGPGESRRLPLGVLASVSSASWFPDGKRILVWGHEAGRADRSWVQDLSGGPPRPVTAEGTVSLSLSPDGSRIVASRPDRTRGLQGLEGDDIRPVLGLESDDSVIRWSVDGRSLFVHKYPSLPLRIERLDLATGRRELVRELNPADRKGVLVCSRVTLSDDAKCYAYRIYRMTSQLFVVEGGR